MQTQYRQGDVMIEARAIPDSAKLDKTQNGRVVLAYGEVTGHAHAFYTDRVRFFRDSGSDGVSHEFIRVDGPGPAELKHEEHGTIEVPPGDYEVVRQREYTPTENRQVAD
jgi:hypothetical protein